MSATITSVFKPRVHQLDDGSWLATVSGDEPTAGKAPYYRHYEGRGATREIALSRAQGAKDAAPYIATAKAGDVLRVEPCANPPGWWSVLRNGQPIHHYAAKDAADALCIDIASADIAS